MPTLFDKARRKQLQSKDYDSYIDPGVSASDRTIARRLMALMPPNERGDFLFYDDRTGRVISNNLRLAQRAAIQKGVLPKSPIGASGGAQSGTASSSNRSTHSIWPYSGCSPPFKPGSGPYLRMVSKCGFAGGIGFVNIGCNSSQMYEGDSGNVYLEVTNNTSAGGGLIEGGLSYLTDYYDVGNAANTGVVPYYRSTYLNQYTNMNNGGFHYNCGEDMVIAHGVVNGTTPGAEMLTYTFTAQTPNNFSPFSWWAGAVYHDWINPVWGFFRAPAVWNTPNTLDAAHVPTPCSGCSIATVTTIAQRGQDKDDGSYFGETFNGQTIHWMQVGFGEWLTGCGPNASVCYIAASHNRNIYYGGEQVWNGNGTAVHWSGPRDLTYGPWETSDGLATHSSPYFNNGIRPASAFSSVVPPDCAVDGYGYCVAQTAGPGFHQDTVMCMAGNYNASMGPVNVGWQSFWINSSTGVLQQFTHHAFDDPNMGYDCSWGDYWDPAEPNSYYGDPNLP
ncbi:MAG TPA: hypothetical protein VGC72_02705 [Candidatus Elarobacter sp.]